MLNDVYFATNSLFLSLPKNISMKKNYIFLIIVFSLQITFSQNNNTDVNVGIISNNPKKWDTTCYTSYSHKLNIYVGSSRLNYNIDITSTFKHPYKYNTNVNYTTFMPLSYSAGFSFDKISLGIGFAKKYDFDSTQSKPKTSYTAFNFSFGGNKFIIEPYYVKFKGFYDENTPNNDTTYKKNKKYHSDPSMTIQSIKVNGIYFLNNKRFAYRSLSGFTYRQLKSKGSWLLLANAYYTKLKSDSIIYPKSVELAYDSVEKLNSFEIAGGSIGGGYGYIWTPGKKKRFFIGFTAGLLFGIQQRNIHFKDSVSISETKFSSGFDFRFSTGWTTDKFFLVIYASGDRMQMKYLKVTMTPYTIPVNAVLGFRFNVKPPKFYRWFMNTKVYDLM